MITGEDEWIGRSTLRPYKNKNERQVRVGVVWFGFGLMLVASVVGWFLEKIGVLNG